MRQTRTRFFLVIAALFALSSCRSAGEFGSEPENLAASARLTFKSMMSDNQYPGLVDLATRAKAIIIVPDLIRAALFFGGRGGDGIMLVRGADGTWSNPAFYTLAGASWGLQGGIQSSELVITVMTEKGLNAIMNREVTLGGDAGLAIGELGKGVNAATGLGAKADMYAFARSQGLFVGVSLDGSVIHPRQTWNQQLYGQGATPKSILIDRTSASNSPAVKELVAAMP
ncbi:MAG: lipid-binding SYLF domain-containing protein [Alphaproteobacteria bacterium]|nr:lipid-binding SYLF domain-containing protein [Alphaproteobacteria bacterium]